MSRAPAPPADASPAAAERRRGRARVLAAAALWGTSAALARLVFRDHHVPALQVVELRLLFAVLLLGGWLAWRDPAKLRVRREDLGYFLILGLFGTAAIQSTYYYSIAVLGVGLAILIQYLAPALIVGFETLRGRPLHPSTVVALIAALAGTAMLVGDVPRSIRATPWQWAICFASGFIFAFYILYSKRGMSRYAPETILFHTFLVAGVFWAIVIPPWRILAAGYPPKLWAMFLALGVFSTLLPFRLFYAGLRRLSPSEASILATFEPAVAVVAAALFLGEGLRPLQWGGALLVLLASVLASRETPGAVEAQAERG